MEKFLLSLGTVMICFGLGEIVFVAVLKLFDKK